MLCHGAATSAETDTGFPTFGGLGFTGGLEVSVDTLAPAMALYKSTN